MNEIKHLRQKIKDIKKIYLRPLMKGFRQAGNLIKKAAKKNFMATGLAPTLAQGITSRVWRNQQGVYIGLKKDYRLSFFEVGAPKGGGTRLTKKGYNRGKIKALYFFRSAVDATEQQARDIIIKGINEGNNEFNAY